MSLNFIYWMNSFCLFLVNSFHILRLNDVVLSHLPKLKKYVLLAVFFKCNKDESSLGALSRVNLANKWVNFEKMQFFSNVKFEQ